MAGILVRIARPVKTSPRRMATVAGADTVAREAADLAETIGFNYARGRAAHVRGEVALARGVVHEAMAHLRSAVDIFDAPYEWVRAILSLATALRASRDEDGASRSRTDALNAAKRMGAGVPLGE